MRDRTSAAEICTCIAAAPLTLLLRDPNNVLKVCVVGIFDLTQVERESSMDLL